MIKLFNPSLYEIPTIVDAPSESHLSDYNNNIDPLYPNYYDLYYNVPKHHIRHSHLGFNVNDSKFVAFIKRPLRFIYRHRVIILRIVSFILPITIVVICILCTGTLLL